MLNRALERDWAYFLTLESDLVELARYIEFSPDNFECYSLEIAKQILSAGSELDVTLKRLAKVRNQDGSASNIEDYRREITRDDDRFHELAVDLRLYDIRLTPWLSWGEGINPMWWKAYNKVKHHRDSMFHEANLENLLNLMAGLYLVKTLTIAGEHCSDDAYAAASSVSIIPAPKLFSTGELFVRGIHHDRLDW